MTDFSPTRFGFSRRRRAESSYPDNERECPGRRLHNEKDTEGDPKQAGEHPQPSLVNSARKRHAATIWMIPDTIAQKAMTQKRATAVISGHATARTAAPMPIRPMKISQARSLPARRLSPARPPIPRITSSTPGDDLR